ncbi:hypothetical protein J6590_002473 [Homalodisca vitripennis]|nr:hypothetical protein J6590_002473 [Homalodisca vitripennis]
MAGTGMTCVNCCRRVLGSLLCVSPTATVDSRRVVQPSSNVQVVHPTSPRYPPVIHKSLRRLIPHLGPIVDATRHAEYLIQTLH